MSVHEIISQESERSHKPPCLEQHVPFLLSLANEIALAHSTLTVSGTLACSLNALFPKAHLLSLQIAGYGDVLVSTANLQHAGVCKVSFLSRSQSLAGAAMDAKALLSTSRDSSGHALKDVLSALEQFSAEELLCLPMILDESWGFVNAAMRLSGQLHADDMIVDNYLASARDLPCVAVLTVGSSGGALQTRDVANLALLAAVLAVQISPTMDTVPVLSSGSELSGEASADSMEELDDDDSWSQYDEDEQPEATKAEVRGPSCKQDAGGPHQGEDEDDPPSEAQQQSAGEPGGVDGGHDGDGEPQRGEESSDGDAEACHAEESSDGVAEAQHGEDCNGGSAEPQHGEDLKFSEPEVNMARHAVWLGYHNPTTEERYLRHVARTSFWYDVVALSLLLAMYMMGWMRVGSTFEVAYVCPIALLMLTYAFAYERVILRYREPFMVALLALNCWNSLVTWPKLLLLESGGSVTPTQAFAMTCCAIYMSLAYKVRAKWLWLHLLLRLLLLPDVWAVGCQQMSGGELWGPRSMPCIAGFHTAAFLCAIVPCAAAAWLREWGSRRSFERGVA